jgi:chromosomal replication initiator protein
MDAWSRFLDQASALLGPEPVARWLRPLRVVRFDAANLYLETEEPMAVAWFEEHARPLVKEKLRNQNFRSIHVHLSLARLTNYRSKRTIQSSATNHPPFGERTDTLDKPRAESEERPIRSDPLDPSMEFSYFVECPGNRIAAQLLRDSLAARSPLFNPIFLYGASRSGKTHLLMGMAAEALRAHKRVFYVSADAFTHHVVQAIRRGRMQEFRKVYRDAELLLVDQVDRLSGRTATQEEFFHTFNALHTAGRQIVLASQFPPAQLKEIEPRLVSRFEWGIALRVESPPSRDLLLQKARAWNLSLSEPVVQFLIEAFSDPIEPLQALSLRGIPSPLSVESAQIILRDLLAKQQRNALTPEQIVKRIAAHFGVTAEDLMGKGQAREVSVPRQIAMYVCRHKLEMTFQSIGKWFGRDHSTVMSSVKSVEKSLEENNRDIAEAVETASHSSG